jgi:hypothetical protein
MADTYGSPPGPGDRLLEAVRYGWGEWQFARRRGLGVRDSARAAWSGAVFAWEFYA